ncbi:NUDIX hydrolase [Paenibacillus mucilaginosus]|uniref:MutT/nudix family protein n=1 Tax=Paenibacillus mucilaginosus (strain KNP414) TaxID=1036673 RepID=F8FLG8_PAEMK|nr:NUDIX domain-containing protein [Paenibacillus mucilaginosus]AEI43536.1 MutT/nudix family protein [Paenibacillus mucilaginosus KNP414]MCG7211924.1 NUDIX domain-containing protein [Paenibacillus mucilaginosus]WDM25081.1 NUDIX domain-containing protein [Paenibacillus mucilaginosus]
MTGHIDKIAWVHLREGRILCARSKGKDIYYMPGGKREAGESDTDTLVREIEEELSVRILPGTVSPLGTFEAQAHGKAEGVRVRMACYLADYEGELCPASEIAEIAWLAYADRERVSSVNQIIFDRLHEMNLLA